MYARRGGLVGTSRSPRPSSSHSAIAVGFLDEQRIGAGVDREAVDVFAQDDAAGARRALEDDERESRCVQLVGGREPGDAAADDDRVRTS